MLAGEGNNRLNAGNGNDTLITGSGADTLSGGGDDDLLDAGSGADRLRGGAGDDRLLGGEGDDSLSGDAGDDVLTGGTGNDLMRGGAGNDRFVFETAEFGQDTIRDFRDGDLLDFSGAGLTLADFTVTADGRNAVLTLTDDPAQTLTLERVDPLDLDTLDFV